MKCAICGRECDRVFPRLGGYCCEGHRQEILDRYRRLLEGLLVEDPALMPQTLAVPDFERFALKLAVHLLAGISAGMRQLYRQAAPQLLDPAVMALEIKEVILRQLPATHVALQEAQGLDLLLHSGTYSFLQPVPAPLMLEALEKAGLLPILDTPEEDEEP